MYFKTEKKCIADAWRDFYKACKKNGIEIGEPNNIKLVLRDEEYNDIETNY
jgi:hypothetical protein